MGPNDGPQLVQLSTYKQRLAKTPKSINGGGKSDGYWTGERGESTFIFNNPDIQKIVPDGIPYQNAYADFSSVTLHEVRLPGAISTNRTTNFNAANAQLAERLGVDESAVRSFLGDQSYTWHEVQDMRTMQLVPSFIHTNKVNSVDNFGVQYKHFGGIGEKTLLEKGGR